MPQFIEKFYNNLTQEEITITPEQGSSFAKEVARDFNPIHDAESKRFCVPGDLLLALTLHKYGLHQKMSFDFQGMVGKNTHLVFPSNSANRLELKDTNDKTYLVSEFTGEVQQDKNIIESFIKEFVTLSGKGFQDGLVPLMHEQGIMINTKKPMVIYDSMEFSLDELNPQNLELRFTKNTLQHDNKRGTAILGLGIFDGEKQIGSGSKTMILSGLRPLVEEELQELIDAQIAASARSS